MRILKLTAIVDKNRPVSIQDASPSYVSKDTVNQNADEESYALEQINGTLCEIIHLPSIRNEMVELGKRLASDPDYPSMEVIDEISKVLHRNLYS